MPITALPPEVHLEGTGGVSRTVSKGLAWSLREAEFLDLLYVAVSPAAHALAGALLPRIVAAEGRTRQRGPNERAKLLEALGACLGGLLVPSLKAGRMVQRPMGKASFIGGATGYLQAKPVLAGLEHAGYVIRYPGIQFRRPVEGAGAVSSGMNTRFAATAALHDLAEAHGVTAATVAGAFTRRYPLHPPKVAQLLTLRTYEARRGRHTPRGWGSTGTPMAIARGDTMATKLRREVKLANTVLARCLWEGCQPPRLYRAFRGDWMMGGRWIVAGGFTIQTMAPEARLLVTMNGYPVAECDATASQLTILAGLAGVPQLPPDPYVLPGFSRNAVKRVVVVSLGRGGLIARWPRRTLEDYPELADVPIKPLSAALGAAYPFLHDPGAVLGVDRQRVSLRLQNLEAAILTHALLSLWRADIPAVPIHDGILAPSGNVEIVRDAIRLAYREGAGGAIVRVTVAPLRAPRSKFRGGQRSNCCS